MISFIFKSLKRFRPVFSHTSTWLLFCMVVICFLSSSEMIGVTSFCRFFGLDEKGYYSLLHFFRCSPWSLTTLSAYWATFVFSQKMTISIDGRIVMIGDHTYVPKNGRRMPGVVALRQHSETQSKPSYFRGHCWGAIAVLIGNITTPFCLPLHFSIHQGFVHIGEDSKKSENRQTLGSRIIQMAINIAVNNNLPSILVLDAYFPSGSIFKLANSVWSITLKQPFLQLIVRAKKNYIAYFQAEKKKTKKSGRPAVYGEKIKLMEMFDHLYLFENVNCCIYGKFEEIKIMTSDLLWKPAGSLVRFVFALTSRGPIILMCSDLNADPIIALELYCARIRVEGMFDMLKNLIRAFQYRFWSKQMPKESRKPKKNKKLSRPKPENVDTIKRCWEACEKFVMLGAISLGLLQMIAIKYTNLIWNQYEGFLRTRSRDIPSERTVKHVISNLLIANYHSLPSAGILSEIRKRFFRDDKFFSR